jgi:hypothetical protein
LPTLRTQTNKKKPAFHTQQADDSYLDDQGQGSPRGGKKYFNNRNQQGEDEGRGGGRGGYGGYQGRGNGGYQGRGQGRGVQNRRMANSNWGS